MRPATPSPLQGRPGAADRFRSMLPGGLVLAAGWLLALQGCEQTTVAVLEVASVEVSPDEVTLFEGDQETLRAILRGRGGSELTGRAVSWSVDDPDVAGVDGNGVIEGRSPGQTLVHAAADGVQGSAEVSVLAAPRIDLSTNSVSLQGIAGDDSFVEREVQVANAGDGALEGLSADISGSAPWLQAELGSSTAPTTLVVRARARDLSPGAYEAAIEVSSPVARNSPVQLSVRFDVAEPPPELRVEDTAVSLSARSGSHEPATQTVRVENAGGGTLSPIEVSVRHITGSNWLSASAQGSTAPTDVLIQASSRFLLPGEYRGVVVISSPVAVNERVEVAVTFLVEGVLDGSP